VSYYFKFLIFLVLFGGFSPGVIPSAHSAGCFKKILDVIYRKPNSSPHYLFTPYKGKLVFKTGQQITIKEAKLPFFLLGENMRGEIYHLGSGLGGGSVYKVIPETGSVVTVKRYNVLDNLNSDQKAFEWLRSVYKKDDSINYRVMQTSPEEKTRDFIRVENLEGQTLEDLLISKALSSPEKQELLRRYEAMIEQIEASIISSFPHVGYIRDKVPFEALNPLDLPVVLFNEDEFYVGLPKLLIKPDNVLIDSKTMEMIIIDPF
jgi:hypothetical protein